jgi:hypothetical protein
VRIVLGSLAVILAFVTVLGAAQSQKKPPLTNQDIVRMVKDKFSDSTIVKAIEANHTAFDVSATALIALKDSGVSQTVIEAMLSAQIPKGANAAAKPGAKAGNQAQASSPQPAQSATSAPSSPTQSQAQSTATCSDVPFLKRGRQPALPPCPDTPLAASPPADSVPTHSPSPTEPLIERAREAAFEFSEKLPNFICEEVMKRYTQQGRGEETPVDVVSADIIYRDSQESYRNVKINDRPTDQALEEIDGSWSTGEFASTLVEIFHPRTDAQFRSVGPSAISGFDAQLYDFQVRSENSHWKVQSGSQTLTPAYVGSVWVDPKTARVLRIEMQARDIPSDFPMDTVESAVDYSYVVIGGASFLLPVHAESLGCERSTSNCSHNKIDFRNYHELEVDFKLLPSPSP